MSVSVIGRFTTRCILVPRYVLYTLCCFTLNLAFFEVSPPPILTVRLFCHLPRCWILVFCLLLGYVGLFGSSLSSASWLQGKELLTVRVRYSRIIRLPFEPYVLLLLFLFDYVGSFFQNSLFCRDLFSVSLSLWDFPHISLSLLVMSSLCTGCFAYVVIP